MAVQSRPRSIRLLVVTLISASLLTITVDYKQGESGPLAGAGRAALRVLGPLQEAVSKVTRPVGDFLSGLTHLPSQQAEIDRLRLELAAKEAQALHAQSLERQLHDLESKLGIRSALDLPTVTATVIGNGVSNFEWTITIDRGTSDGVAVDMPVVTGSGLVGRVIRANPSEATVQLIIDPKSAVTVRLVSSGKAGLLEGAGEDDLQLQFIDPATPVPEFERVETASYRLEGGQTGLYPAGIPVGTVSHVLADPGALDKSATVRPAVDFSTLDYVLVVVTPDARG